MIGKFTSLFSIQLLSESRGSNAGHLSRLFQIDLLDEVLPFRLGKVVRSEFKGFFGDKWILRIVSVGQDFGLEIWIILYIVLVDPLDIRPVPLIKGIEILIVGLSSSDSAFSDQVVELEVDVAGDPVVERAKGLIDFPVKTLAPVVFEQFKCDFLLRQPVFLNQGKDLSLNGSVKPVFVFPVI